MNSLTAKEKACAIRTDIIEMVHEAGSGHPGGSLSCTDILSALYFGGVLKHDPSILNGMNVIISFLAKVMRHLLCMPRLLKQDICQLMN